MRIIGHLDMDAFFAAVEERDNPSLAGLPIVVGADPDGGYGRGVVSTANYKAREYGIYSAMPISRAWRLSEEAKKKGKPAAIFLRGNFQKYAEASAHIMEILRKHSPTVEEASIDEAYFELTWRLGPQVREGSRLPWEKAAETAQKIKKEIFEKEKLTGSIGIGPNKLIAKIASDFKKPDGLTVVKEADAEKFLEPMGVRKIPGIGPKAEEKLAARGVFLMRDIRKLSKDELGKLFGKWGFEMYERVRGRDDSPLITEREAKSIGEQTTFQKDTSEPDFLMKELDELCKDVFARFKKDGWKSFRTVAITVRFSDFETKTRSHTVKSPASSAGGSVSNIKDLELEALKLFLPFLDSRENPHRKAVRLLGIRIERLL